jgi:hypothetical protein
LVSDHEKSQKQGLEPEELEDPEVTAQCWVMSGAVVPEAATDLDESKKMVMGGTEDEVELEPVGAVPRVIVPITKLSTPELVEVLVEVVEEAWLASDLSLLALTQPESASASPAAARAAVSRWAVGLRLEGWFKRGTPSVYLSAYRVGRESG